MIDRRNIREIDHTGEFFGLRRQPRETDALSVPGTPNAQVPPFAGSVWALESGPVWSLETPNTVFSTEA